jgi:hypothetical protein
VLFLGFHQQRDFLEAGRAPGGPEVQQQQLAAPLGQRVRLPVEPAEGEVGTRRLADAGASGPPVPGAEARGRGDGSRQQQRERIA